MSNKEAYSAVLRTSLQLLSHLQVAGVISMEDANLSINACKLLVKLQWKVGRKPEIKHFCFHSKLYTFVNVLVLVRRRNFYSNQYLCLMKFLKPPVLFLVVFLYHLVDNQCSWYNLYIYMLVSQTMYNVHNIIQHARSLVAHHFYSWLTVDLMS